MLTLLVIGRSAAALAPPGARVEILRARDIEDGLEMLARNRRIDAILVLPEEAPSPIISAISEEVSAPPPIFVACGSRACPADSRAVAEDPSAAIEAICRELD